MQTHKKKKATSLGPQVRSLKLQPEIRFGTGYANKKTTIVPYLRLMGKWMQELGFNPGERVTVTAEHGCLTIRPEK